MPATAQNLSHYAGDSKIITLGPVVDDDGAIVDLSGAIARWWMGKNVKATGDNVYIQKSSPSSGVTLSQTSPDVGWYITITLDPADTDYPTAGIKAGIYYHECEVVAAGGTVSTVTVGSFTLIATMIPDNL